MNEPLITKTETAALLGRPLTSVEDTNYTLYLNIAVLRLEDLICQDLASIELADDLKLLLARCFGVISLEQGQAADSNVESKKVEDFSITYKDETKTAAESFAETNANLIAKYSMCQAKIRSGEVRHDCFRFI